MNEAALAKGTRVNARLLFCALPPYFLRALLDGHADKTKALAGLEIVEMAKATAVLPDRLSSHARRRGITLSA